MRLADASTKLAQFNAKREHIAWNSLPAESRVVDTHEVSDGAIAILEQASHDRRGELRQRLHDQQMRHGTSRLRVSNADDRPLRSGDELGSSRTLTFFNLVDGIDKQKRIAMRK